MKKIANTMSIPEGKAIVVDIEGFEIALFKVNGEIFALENACPHMGGPLAEGEISLEDSKVCVTCPWHGWQFELSTGTCENIPYERAKKIEVIVKEGWVYLT